MSTFITTGPQTPKLLKSLATAAKLGKSLPVADPTVKIPLSAGLNVFLIVSFLGTVSNTPFGDEVHTLMSLLAIVGNETAPKFINAVFEPVPPMVSNNVV